MKKLGQQFRNAVMGLFFTATSIASAFGQDGTQASTAIPLDKNGTELFTGMNAPARDTIVTPTDTTVQEQVPLATKLAGDIATRIAQNWKVTSSDTVHTQTGNLKDGQITTDSTATYYDADFHLEDLGDESKGLLATAQNEFVRDYMESNPDSTRVAAIAAFNEDFKGRVQTALADQLPPAPDSTDVEPGAVSVNINVPDMTPYNPAFDSDDRDKAIHEAQAVRGDLTDTEVLELDIGNLTNVTEKTWKDLYKENPGFYRQNFGVSSEQQLITYMAANPIFWDPDHEDFDFQESKTAQLIVLISDHFENAKSEKVAGLGSVGKDALTDRLDQDPVTYTEFWPRIMNAGGHYYEEPVPEIGQDGIATNTQAERGRVLSQNPDSLSVGERAAQKEELRRTVKGFNTFFGPTGSPLAFTGITNILKQELANGVDQTILEKPFNEAWPLLKISKRYSIHSARVVWNRAMENVENADPDKVPLAVVLRNIAMRDMPVKVRLTEIDAETLLVQVEKETKKKFEIPQPAPQPKPAVEIGVGAYSYSNPYMVLPTDRATPLTRSGQNVFVKDHFGQKPGRHGEITFSAGLENGHYQSQTYSDNLIFETPDGPWEGINYSADAGFKYKNHYVVGADGQMQWPNRTSATAGFNIMGGKGGHKRFQWDAGAGKSFAQGGGISFTVGHKHEVDPLNFNTNHTFNPYQNVETTRTVEHDTLDYNRILVDPLKEQEDIVLGEPIYAQDTTWAYTDVTEEQCEPEVQDVYVPVYDRDSTQIMDPVITVVSDTIYKPKTATKVVCGEPFINDEGKIDYVWVSRTDTLRDESGNIIWIPEVTTTSDTTMVPTGTYEYGPWVQTGMDTLYNVPTGDTLCQTIVIGQDSSIAQVVATDEIVGYQPKIDPVTGDTLTQTVEHWAKDEDGNQAFEYVNTLTFEIPTEKIYEKTVTTALTPNSFGWNAGDGKMTTNTWDFGTSYTDKKGLGVGAHFSTAKVDLPIYEASGAADLTVQTDEYSKGFAYWADGSTPSDALVYNQNNQIIGVDIGDGQSALVQGAETAKTTFSKALQTAKTTIDGKMRTRKVMADVSKKFPSRIMAGLQFAHSWNQYSARIDRNGPTGNTTESFVRTFKQTTVGGIVVLPLGKGNTTLSTRGSYNFGDAAYGKGFGGGRFNFNVGLTHLFNSKPSQMPKPITQVRTTDRESRSTFQSLEK